MDTSAPIRPFPRRAVHLDFHTMPGVPDMGRDFDADEFADTLKNAGAEYVNLFAKCNLGFCYYPTRIGAVYPGLERDLFGDMLRACRARGLGVSAYFNVGLGHEQALRRRDWCVVNEQGQVYAFDKMDHWFRTMCFQSGYRDYILALIDEVLANYPVDGLLLDSMSQTVCLGVECLDAMRANGLDPRRPEDRREQGRLTQKVMLEAIESLVLRRNPRLYRYYLGVADVFQPTHHEVEVLPQGGWGYDFLPWYIRYIRTLGKPFSLMTGRFWRSWGDLSGLRPRAALEYDCRYAAACGANVCVGDHLHPRGRLHPAVYREIGAVYAELARLDEWCENTRAVSDVLVLAPHLTRGFDAADPNVFRGLGRMLCELKVQYDVGNGQADFSGYDVLVLPDVTELDDALAARVNRHVAGGGKVVASAFAGVDRAANRFRIDALDEAVEFLGEEPEHYTFIHTDDGPEGVPAMELPCYVPGAALRLRPGARGAATHGRLFRGYFRHRHFDYRHEYLYIPEDADTGRPPLVSAADGRVWHFAPALGRAYYEYAHGDLRDWLGRVLARLLPEPALRVTGLPSFGMASVLRQENRLLVHLLNYVPEKRGARMEIVEDALATVGATLDIRLPRDAGVTRAYAAPERAALAPVVERGRVRLAVPEFRGHTLVVVELDGDAEPAFQPTKAGSAKCQSLAAQSAAEKR